MDRNVALAMLFLFSVVADVAHARRFRYIAGDPHQNNPSLTQVLAENKLDPNQNGAVKKPENVQPTHDSQPLNPKPVNKTDLVSPPLQSQNTDHSKNFNFLNPGSSAVQNHTLNNEETPKAVDNKETGMNLSSPDKAKDPEHVNGTDLLSPHEGKNQEHVNGSDLLSPPVNEIDNGKNGGDREKIIDDKNNETGTGKNGRTKDKTINDKNNETGTVTNGGANEKNGGAEEKTIDDKSKESDNEKNGRAKDDKNNETDNGKNGGAKEKEKTVDDKSTEMYNERNGGKEKTIGDKSSETGNGKNDGAEEKTIDDKSNATDNDKKGGVKDKTIGDKSSETDNGKNGGAKEKEKTVDDKSNEIDSGENGRKEKTIDGKSNETDNRKNDGVKENSTDDKSSPESGVNETCYGLHKCKDLDTLIACIQSFDTGSKELTVLVQNDGEKTLMVNLTIPTAIENPLRPLKVSEHHTQKITISLSASMNAKVILNAGNGECVLYTDHREPEEIFFIYLPSYNKILTPINGAYFMILSVLIFGGTWACCMRRKRRWNDGVPYQELEMGLPESVSATNVETAEGWDQGWDDDWDENNSVKSPGASRIGSISANGLTSRSPNRDGWENDWDE